MIEASNASLPQGAAYIENFISAAEEAALASQLDGLVWSSELKRRVQHFGYRYDYRARTITADAFLGNLPGWLMPICQRLVAEGHFKELPTQVIANEYLPGQGISAHVDCVPCFGGRVVSLSLLSSCQMIFRCGGNAEKKAILAPRSLMCIAGPARYEWTHEIPARLSDVVSGVKIARNRRISLTFRNVISFEK